MRRKGLIIAALLSVLILAALSLIFYVPPAGTDPPFETEPPPECIEIVMPFGEVLSEYHRLGSGEFERWIESRPHCIRGRISEIRSDDITFREGSGVDLFCKFRGPGPPIVDQFLSAIVDRLLGPERSIVDQLKPGQEAVVYGDVSFERSRLTDDDMDMHSCEVYLPSESTATDDPSLTEPPSECTDILMPFGEALNEYHRLGVGEFERWIESRPQCIQGTISEIKQEQAGYDIRFRDGEGVDLFCKGLSAAIVEQLEEEQDAVVYGNVSFERSRLTDDDMDMHSCKVYLPPEPTAIDDPSLTEPPSECTDILISFSEALNQYHRLGSGGFERWIESRAHCIQGRISEIKQEQAGYDIRFRDGDGVDLFCKGLSAAIVSQLEEGREAVVYGNVSFERSRLTDDDMDMHSCKVYLPPEPTAIDDPSLTEPPSECTDILISFSEALNQYHRLGSGGFERWIESRPQCIQGTISEIKQEQAGYDIRFREGEGVDLFCKGLSAAIVEQLEEGREAIVYGNVSFERSRLTDDDMDLHSCEVYLPSESTATDDPSLTEPPPECTDILISFSEVLNEYHRLGVGEFERWIESRPHCIQGTISEIKQEQAGYDIRFREGEGVDLFCKGLSAAIVEQLAEGREAIVYGNVSFERSRLTDDDMDLHSCEVYLPSESTATDDPSLTEPPSECTDILISFSEALNEYHRLGVGEFERWIESRPQCIQGTISEIKQEQAGYDIRFREGEEWICSARVLAPPLSSSWRRDGRQSSMGMSVLNDHSPATMTWICTVAKCTFRLSQQLPLTRR